MTSQLVNTNFTWGLEVSGCLQTHFGGFSLCTVSSPVWYWSVYPIRTPFGSRGLSHFRWTTSVCLWILKYFGAPGSMKGLWKLFIFWFWIQTSHIWRLIVANATPLKHSMVNPTSLLGVELHNVALWSLIFSISHHHVHLVFAIWKKLSQDARGLFCRGEEAFMQLCLVHFQALNEAGLPPVVQLRIWYEYWISSGSK